jgi:uncharacterized protein
VIVVSDSSPLIILARARHLELLRELYAEVTIPREVYEEVTVAGAGLPARKRFEELPGFGCNRIRRRLPKS